MLRFFSLLFDVRCVLYILFLVSIYIAMLIVLSVFIYMYLQFLAFYLPSKLIHYGWMARSIMLFIDCALVESRQRVGCSH